MYRYQGLINSVIICNDITSFNYVKMSICYLFINGEVKFKVEPIEIFAANSSPAGLEIQEIFI